MRILLSSREFPPDVGGIGTYALELAQAAAELGHEVTVAAPLRPTNSDGESVLAAKGRIKLVRCRGRSSPRADVLPLARLAYRLLRRGDFDVAHACDRASLLAFLLVRASRRARLCVTVHGSETHRWKRSMLYRWVDPVAYGSAQRVATNSSYTEECFREMLESGPPRCGGPPTRSIPLAVSDWWFEPPPVESVWTRPVDSLVIGTVGRLDPRKGHERVLEAASHLPVSLRQRIIYVVVGPGPPDYATRLRARASSLGIHLVLLFAVERDQLPALYRQMDLHALFARPAGTAVEGFGLVILEAGTQEVPTVASRVGGIPEVVDHGASGWLVDADDVQAFAEGLERLLTDDRLRQSLGQGARCRARSRNWRDVARATYGFFGSLPTENLVAPRRGR